MDAEHWQRIQDLFEEAVELDPSERERFLRDQCDGDASLISEVHSLINADDRQNSLLDNKASDLIDVTQPASRVGQRIGPYRIVSQIASGGMGTVFMAERSDGQFSQTVALKVIKRGMDTDEILRRFHAERQILAGLDHPNISRLIDGGLTDEGLPWFSMEYVDGDPIDVYCDNNRLTIEERERLFLTVCRAVQHAQQNLVVHRDLKPNNILVTDDGTVKLLDFGIAKLLGGNDSDDGHNELTRTGVRVMTPGYASPEQVRGAAVTTSSDVYSLGVVLYYLLAGVRPYNVRSQTPQEMEKAICETDPHKPSNAMREQSESEETVAEDRGSLTRICESRRTIPARLRRLLAGDLDNICMMALRKDPEIRYKTSGELADDIGRHLEGHPVHARKVSLSYRAGKFIGRHRFSFAAALAFLVIVSSLIGVYTVKLAGERDKAKAEAAKAAEVTEFLTSIFNIADPNESRGETVTARELLDRGAERIGTELSGQPETQAAMMSLLGQVYIQLGLLERADTLLTEALDIRLERLGKNNPDISRNYHDLAVVTYDLGEFDRSEELYRKALEIDLNLWGEESAGVAEDMNDLAATLKQKGEIDEALPLFEKALAIREKVFGEMNADVAHSMNHLGGLLHDKGDDVRAEQLIRRGLAIRENLYGSMHVEVVASLGNLARLLLSEGKLDSAEHYYSRAQVILDTLVGRDHYYYGSIVGNLARVHFLKGEIDIADSLCSNSLAIMKHSLPEGHISISYPMQLLGEIYIAENKLDDAEALLRESLRIREKSLPDGHVRIAQASALLGICLSKMSATQEARDMLQRGLPILVEESGAQDSLTQRAGRSLVSIDQSLGLLDEADSLKAVLEGPP